VIKVRGKAGGKDLVILGLSRANVDRLMDNQPIMFDMAQLGFPNQTLVICGGETNESINEDLRSIGFRPDHQPGQEA
jgi:hypothetical protein